MYKFTDKSNEVNNVEIDLRHHADGLTSEFGIDMLYIRNTKFVRCRCFDDVNKIGNPKCPLCMGTGHFASIQKIRAIESSNSAYSSTNSVLATNIGATDQKNEIYYLDSKYAPKERDYLLKVTWKQGYPVDVIKVLEIINVYEMRGDGGRVELNGCVINNKTDMIKPFTDALRRLPKKAVQEMLRGGKSIWPNKLIQNLETNVMN